MMIEHLLLIHSLRTKRVYPFLNKKGLLILMMEFYFLFWAFNVQVDSCTNQSEACLAYSGVFIGIPH